MKKFIRFILWIITVASAYAGFTVYVWESTFFWRVLLVWSWLAWDDIQNTQLWDTDSAIQKPTLTVISWSLIKTRCFDGGTQMNEAFWTTEFPHDAYNWTGSQLSVHVHWLASTTSTNTGIRYIDYTLLKLGQTYSATYTMTWIIKNTTAWQTNILELNDLSATWVSLWDTFAFRIYRVPTWGDTYAGDLCLVQVWAHYQRDTLWSRQEYIK